MQRADQLRALMSFAQIVDIDFSQWDDRIALLVLDISQPAEAQVQQGLRKFLPLMEVSMVGPKRLEFEFRHDHAKATLAQEQHVQWTVMDSEIEQNENSMVIRLRSWGAEPELVCEASTVEIREVDIEDALAVAPWWGHRRSPPFIRPGLVDMARMIRHR